jgi:hypothetical protein
MIVSLSRRLFILTQDVQCHSASGSKVRRTRVIFISRRWRRNSPAWRTTKSHVAGVHSSIIVPTWSQSVSESSGGGGVGAVACCSNASIRQKPRCIGRPMSVIVGRTQQISVTVRYDVHRYVERR